VQAAPFDQRAIEIKVLSRWDNLIVRPHGTALAVSPGVKVNLGNAPVWLPFAASAFALVFAVVILSDVGITILFNRFGLPLSESPTMKWYVIVHLATGAGLLAGAVIALVAMEARSRTLLVMGQAFASAALATIVIFERMSIWALPYLE
jgi:hypothetical protein